jgi:membrane associated rhomboid family serine protease
MSGQTLATGPTPALAWLDLGGGAPAGCCQEWATVLAAAGIDYACYLDGDRAELRVPAPAAARAAQELAAYRADSRHWPPAPAAPPTPVLRPMPMLGFWAVLLTAHALQVHHFGRVAWYHLGAADADAILHGQWWRAVTALTLHADGEHLLHNLIFGSLFGALLGAELGSGLAWFWIVVAGGLANGLSAWLQAPDHVAIGASTAVFAALGLLLACQRRGVAALPRVRRWAPLLMGGVFLGTLGIGGERTDVVAHACGLVVGGVSGWALAGLAQRLRSQAPTQRLLGLLAVAVLAASWGWAIAG